MNVGRAITEILPLISGEPVELHGVQDGAPIKLPSGISLELRRVGDLRVTRGDLVDVIRGVQSLPYADQALIARLGVPIRILPTSSLEVTNEGARLGATTIETGKGGPTVPTLVRVAARSGRGGAESTSEIVQHELGHVVSVARFNDKTEVAAERYAQQY